jgi:hypothetical protein
MVSEQQIAGAAPHWGWTAEGAVGVRARSVAAIAVAGMALAVVAAAQDGGPRITLELRDAPLSSALATIMEQSGMSYAFGPDVPADALVTIRVQDARFEDALRSMLLPYGLTYTVGTGGIYLIQKKSETRPGIDTGNTREVSEPVEVDQGVTVVKIKLKYTDPYDVWAVLTGNGAGNQLAVPDLSGLWPYANDNSLLARFGGPASWGAPGQAPGPRPQGTPGTGMQGGWPTGNWPGRYGTGLPSGWRGPGPGSGYSGPTGTGSGGGMR